MFNVTGPPINAQTTKMCWSPHTDNTKCWQERGVTGTLRSCWKECEIVQPFGKQNVTKLNVYLLCDSSVPLVDVYPRQKKPHGHKKTYGNV